MSYTPKKNHPHSQGSVLAPVSVSHLREAHLYDELPQPEYYRRIVVLTLFGLLFSRGR